MEHSNRTDKRQRDKMSTCIINFATDFTDCPGGRARINGDYSGEEFRVDVLKPALERADRVVLNLEGVFSFPASFVDEAFGVLVAELGLDLVKRKLMIRCEDNPIAKKAILEAMEGHAA